MVKEKEVALCVRRSDYSGSIMPVCVCVLVYIVMKNPDSLFM